MEKNKIKRLKEILLKAQDLGLNVSDLMRKVNDAASHQEGKTIKIVLLGAFSDGKTTTIAGMTGKLESDMKIAIEESSDDLAFYHIPALGYDFEIVDTPGLFGTKEKEVEGRTVRYSDVTREYISQAHIVMYVTDAVNPLKDSHRSILKFILRDLGKLPNTIFVINKMDEAGYSLIDDDDFANGSRIKKETFISKLNDVIHLSSTEKNDLKIVCIAANPKAKGLSTHFKNMDSYLKRSRMNVLRSELQNMTSLVDKNNLRDSVDQSVITDLANQVLSDFRLQERNINNEIAELCNLDSELRSKLSRVREVVISNRNSLIQELRTVENEILIAVDNASMKNLGIVVTQYYGEKGERLSITIDNIFSKYAESNNSAFQELSINITLERMSELTKGLISSMTKVLRHTKIGADAIKGARDIFAAGFKFKPWGAVNLAAKLSKVLVIVSVALDVIMWWKSHKEQRKFEEAKQELTKCCRNAFKDADTFINPEKKYFENFAPGISAIETVIKDNQNNISSSREVAKIIKEFLEEISQWVRSNNTDNVSY